MKRDRYRKLDEIRPPAPPAFTSEHHVQTTGSLTATAPALQPTKATKYSLPDVGILQTYMGNQAVQQLLRSSSPVETFNASEATDTNGHIPIQRSTPEHNLSTVEAVIQRVNAHRVEYQHNRKVHTDEKGRVTGLTAPIDISFGTDEHSLYFAEARKESQLEGLRTVHWEMKDDWWHAAYYHAYRVPPFGAKKLSGQAQNWLERITSAHCEKMSASDGKDVSREAKKSAPHFSEKWNDILNEAIVKGTGYVEDTEAEMREQIATRDKKKGATSSSIDPYEVGQIYNEDEPDEDYGTGTRAEAEKMGLSWRRLS